MDEEFEGTRVPSRRFQKIDLLILGLSLAAEVLGDVADAFTSAVMFTAAHANYKVDQQKFHEDAAREIETITGEQE